MVASPNVGCFLRLKLSQKHNCEVKKCHVDIDAYCFERALQKRNFKLTAALNAFKML